MTTDDAVSEGGSRDDDTPRWVRWFLLVLILLFLLVLAAILTGGHGPGVHGP